MTGLLSIRNPSLNRLRRRLVATGLVLAFGANLQPAYADIVNTVTANGFFGGTPVSSPSSSVSVDVEDAAPALNVTKGSDVTSVNAAGDAIVYSIRVANTGNVTVSSITVTDTLVGVTCPGSGNNTISSLAPGGIEVCTGTYTVVQADFDLGGANDGSTADGDIDNTASASGTYDGSAVADSDDRAVTLNINRSLTTVKTATLNEEIAVNGFADAGETISYSYLVTNTGNVTLTNVRVDDTHNGSATLPAPSAETLTADSAPALDSTDAGANGAWDSLAPGDAITFTATYSVTQTDVDTLQ